MKFREWAKILLSGEPHFYIGGRDNPYLCRWFLIPRNHIFNIYLHKFLRDDDDRALHDHPWYSLSFLIKGEYIEHTPKGIEKSCAPAVIFRRSTFKHRIELVEGRTAWTLFITGPRVREWGFWCPQGFVHWETFTNPDDSGDIGIGCGE